MRILLMEDNYRLNNSLKMHLADEGYRVDTAYDGQEGQHIWNYDFECEPNVIGLSLLSLSCTEEISATMLLLVPARTDGMTLPWMQADLTNWSKSARSSCMVYRAKDVTEITKALAAARARGFSVIPHGAGHSYTDAALNTNGVVIDLTLMRRILSWDAAQGIMCVEPGVTLQDIVQVAWKDGWWPAVFPIYTSCHGRWLRSHEREWQECLEMWPIWGTRSAP